MSWVARTSRCASRRLCCSGAMSQTMRGTPFFGPPDPGPAPGPPPQRWKAGQLGPAASPLPKQTSHTQFTHRFPLPCSPSCLLLLQSALRLLPPLQLFLILPPQSPPPAPERPQPDQKGEREAQEGREDGCEDDRGGAGGSTIDSWLSLITHGGGKSQMKRARGRDKRGSRESSMVLGRGAKGRTYSRGVGHPLFRMMCSPVTFFFLSTPSLARSSD